MDSMQDLFIACNINLEMNTINKSSFKRQGCNRQYSVIYFNTGKRVSGKFDGYRDNIVYCDIFGRIITA